MKVWSRKWVRYSTLGLAGFLVLLSLVIVGLLSFTMSESGARFAQSKLDGHKIGGAGTLQIEGLRGNLLSSLEADRIALVDEDGTWLEIEDVILRWRPVRMVRKDLIIEELAADTITLYRLPESEEEAREDGGGGALPVSIRLDRLNIDRFDIREDAFGQSAVLRAEGEARYSPGGRTRIVLNAEELTENKDRLALNLSHEPGEGVALDLDAQSAANGLISELMNAPEGEDTTLTALLSGDEQDGGGDLGLAFGENTIADAAIAWTETRLDIEGQLNMGGWPMLSALSSRAGDQADFDITIGDFKTETRALDISIDAPLLSVEASGADLTEGVNTDLTLRQLGDWSGGAVQASILNWNGVIRRADGIVSGEGVAELEALEASLLKAGRVTGPVAFTYGDGGIGFEGDLAMTAVTSTQAALDNLLADRVTAALQGRYDLESGQVSIDPLTVRGGLSADARIAYGVKSGVMEVDARVSEADLAQLSESFGGRVNARAEVRRGGNDSPYRIRLQGGVQGFAAEQELIGDIVGADPRYTANVSIASSGQITVDEARIESEKSAFGAKGALGSEEGYGLDLEGRINGPLTVGSAEIGGTILARGALRGPLDDPSINLTLFADTLDAGGVAFQRPRTEVKIESLTGELKADVIAEAETEYGPAAASFTAARSETGLQLGDLRAELADVTAAGNLALGNGGAEGSVELTKTGEGPSPYPGALDGSLTLSTRNDRQYVALSVEGESLLFPEQDIRLETVSAQTEGYLDNLDFTLAADGSVRGLPSTLEAQGQLQDTETGRRVAVDFNGEYGRLAFSTRDPLTYRFGGGESQLRASLGFDEGVLNLELDSSPEIRRLALEVRDAPLAVLEAMRAGARLRGTLNADAEIINRNGELSGDLRAAVNDAHVADDDLPPVNVTLTGDVTQSSLDLTLEARDEADMRANGNASIAITPNAGLIPVALDSDGPLSGQAALQGAIDSIASLVTGPEQRLGGDIDARLTLGGTMSRQDFNGTVQLSNGRFDDGVSGIALRDLETRAEFANGRVAVTQLEGRDEEDGTLSGSGQARSVEGGWRGEISANFQNFQVANRRDAQVDASGEISINIDPESPTIEGDININRGEFRPPNTGPPGVTTIEVVEINKPGQENPEEETVSGRGRTPFALDISLDAPRRLFVRTNTVNVEMALDARIGGTSASPKIFGTASVIRGDADFAGERFTFNEGEIRFEGDPLQSELDLTATHDAAELTAFINVTGTPQEPRISLTSQPPLPEDEILARVLFGRSVSQLSGLEAAQMAAALSSLAGGGGFDALGQIRSGLGLDRLSIASGSSGTVVTGGQYLTDDVYLELSSGGIEGPAAQIEWQALKNFAVISQFGSAKNTSVSVRWRKDY